MTPFLLTSSVEKDGNGHMLPTVMRNIIFSGRRRRDNNVNHPVKGLRLKPTRHASFEIHGTFEYLIYSSFRFSIIFEQACPKQWAHLESVNGFCSVLSMQDLGCHNIDLVALGSLRYHLETCRAISTCVL